MLSPEDIRARARARYADFLRSVVNGSAFFPLRIRFGKPSSTEDFPKLRREINALTQANLGCCIEWVEVNTRRWGRQRLPDRVEFTDEASYLQSLGKTRDISVFRENLALTREQCSALVSVVEARPLDMVEYGGVWPRLLAVCSYFQQHPRPMLYARELPLNIDTKFIESHEAILSRLLSVVLPNKTAPESCRFEERFGLRFDEPLIRFRILDGPLLQVLRVPFPDISIPASSFSQLDWQRLRVIVSENKMTFLTLPSVANAIGIWGMGNAASLLSRARWLHHCDIIYWGDLDLHGLEILSRLRGVFPSARSVMMDCQTLGRFENLWGSGARYDSQKPRNLTPSEMSAWALIQKDNLRIEQERLPQSFAHQSILKAVSDLQQTTDTRQEIGLVAGNECGGRDAMIPACQGSGAFTSCPTNTPAH